MSSAAAHRKIRSGLWRAHPLSDRVVRDFGEKLRLLSGNLEHRSVTFDDVPAELRRKFISESGRFLLQIHPKVDVWIVTGDPVRPRVAIRGR